MRAGTASKLLYGLLGFLILALALMAIGGDDEARSLLVQTLLVAGTVGSLGYLAYRYRIQPRRAVFSDQAAQLSLRVERGDPTGFLSSAFEVVRRQAAMQDVETTAFGRRGGREVTVVDYWYTPSSETRYDDYVRFVGALLPVPRSWPRLLIVPERIATIVGDAVLGLDPDTEWEMFNRRFALRTDDRRFASAVLDARMLGWIMSLPTHTGFEIRDGRLLCFVARNDLGDVEHALVTAETFLAKVPSAARSVYG